MTDRKNVLVTGAGGFIGGHLVKRLLDEGCKVTGIDRKRWQDWHQYHEQAQNITSVQVRDADMQIGVNWLSGVDEVYHLAADMGGIGYITNHLTACAANIIDTIKLLERCKAGQRVFFASSACVYRQDLQWNSQDTTGLCEEDAFPADPEPGYGWEKLYGEMLMLWHHQERNVETRIARYHNVAGPYGSWKDGREKAPAAICRKVATAVLTKDLEIEIWGDGKQRRSFVDVQDCVTGTLLIARGDYPYPLNIGSDRSVTINELVTMVENIAGGVRLHRRYLKHMPQGVRGRNSDNSLLERTYNWVPSNDIETWLESLYRWIYDEVSKELRQ